MTEFIEQLVTLALTIIILGFSLQSYRMIYKKLRKIEKRQHTTTAASASEAAVRRRCQQAPPMTKKETAYE